MFAELFSVIAPVFLCAGIVVSDPADATVVRDVIILRRRR